MTDELMDHWQQLGRAYDEAFGVVGPAEMAAACHAFCTILEVLHQGAIEHGYRGAFVRQGVAVQVEHLQAHLESRGGPDPFSGLDHLKHALTRAALAVALQDGVPTAEEQVQ